MTAPAVSPSAMTSSPTNTTTSGGRLMRVLLASAGKRVGPTRAEGIRPASSVSMRRTGRRTSEPRDFGGLGPAHSRNAVGGVWAQDEPRDFGGLGPASHEASELEGAAPLPPRTKQHQ